MAAMPASPTRERIVQTSADLFRRQGYVGTGVKQIVAEASAPFGSLYHFFPGGKEQLGAETIRFSGAIYGELIGAFYEPGVDPVTATGAFFAGAAQTLVETDYADACPIATIALEVSSSSEPLREACADVFASWIDGATAALARSGVPAQHARPLAISLLAGLEGAFVLARALRSTEPVLTAACTRRPRSPRRSSRCPRASQDAQSTRSASARIARSSDPRSIRRPDLATASASRATLLRGCRAYARSSSATAAARRPLAEAIAPRSSAA
jgi:AcrR family transcriptional regulator